MTDSELPAKINSMEISITKIEADLRHLLERVMPAWEKQALSITAHDDRLARYEERQKFAETRAHEVQVALELKIAELDKKRVEEHTASIERSKAVEDRAIEREKAIEERLKARGEANARLIMICGALFSAILAAATFLITKVQIKP